MAPGSAPVGSRGTPSLTSHTTSPISFNRSLAAVRPEALRCGSTPTHNTSQARVHAAVVVMAPPSFVAIARQPLLARVTLRVTLLSTRPHLVGALIPSRRVGEALLHDP